MVIEKTKKDGGKTVQTNAWDDFYNKKPRDAASPKDGLGRIKQNFSVLQRLPKPGGSEKNPYGLKLAQFGMTVDIKTEDEHGLRVPYFMLNTSWDDDDKGTTVVPMKPSRRSKAKTVKIKKVTDKVEDKVAVEDKAEVEAEACIECGGIACICPNMPNIPDASEVVDDEWEEA